MYIHVYTLSTNLCSLAHSLTPAHSLLRARTRARARAGSLSLYFVRALSFALSFDIFLFVIVVVSRSRARNYCLSLSLSLSHTHAHTRIHSHPSHSACTDKDHLKKRWRSIGLFICSCRAWGGVLIYMYDMTHSYVCHDPVILSHDSFMCVPWLIHMCHMTQAHVWHDSFICVA